MASQSKLNTSRIDSWLAEGKPVSANASSNTSPGTAPDQKAVPPNVQQHKLQGTWLGMEWLEFHIAPRKCTILYFQAGHTSRSETGKKQIVQAPYFHKTYSVHLVKKVIYDQTHGGSFLPPLCLQHPAFSLCAYC